jgi:hypothetical protein
MQKDACNARRLGDDKQQQQQQQQQQQHVWLEASLTQLRSSSRIRRHPW